MASQNNDRLRKIIAAWPLLGEQGQECILALALALLAPVDYKALNAAGRALTAESPVTNASTP